MAAPYIVGFGETQDSIDDVRVVIEKETVICFSCISEALHYCFAAYYIFSISYPPDFKMVMLTLDTHVYGLMPSSKVPLTVTAFQDSLQRLSSEDVTD